MNRKFSPEFKLQVIEELKTHGFRELERKYDIDHSVIRGWKQKFDEYGEEYFYQNHRIPHNKRKPNYNEMNDKEKIHFLEMENDILKKAIALNQKRI